MSEINYNRIFFTGVPGSKWSGVAQLLEAILRLNTSDRTFEREYNHGAYTGHRGAYFGRGMEFPAELNLEMIDSAWADPHKGIRIVKSHDWAYMLEEVFSFTRTVGDRLMLVYRDSDASFNWWKQVGGFDIKYPNYDVYIDDDTMFNEIKIQNENILQFCKNKSIELENFDGNWIEKNFDTFCDVKNIRNKYPTPVIFDGVSVALI